MHVHAHPDDESSKGAATMAKYVAEGVDVHVVTCTGGERGSILNPKLDRPDDRCANITEVRRQEMDAAREILGVRQDWLGFVDSGLPEGDPQPPLPEGCFALVPLEEAAEPLVRLIRDVPAARDDDVRRERRLPAPRPHHVPQGLDGGVRGGRRPRALPRRGRAVAAAEALLPPRLQPAADRRRCTRRCSRAAWSRRTPSGWRSWEDAPSERDRITTRVPCADYFEVRDQALLAHATQIDPDGRWFRVPLEHPAARSGRPRTSSWRVATSTIAAARGRPVRRAGLPRGGRRAGDQHRAADRVRRNG